MDRRNALRLLRPTQLELFGQPELSPEPMAISALSLDDVTVYRPQANIYMQSAPPWTAVDKAVPAFDRMPPVPGR